MAEVLNEIAAEVRAFGKGVEWERARSKDALAALQAKLAEAEAKVLVVAERSGAAGADKVSGNVVSLVTPEKTAPPPQVEAPQKETVMSWNIANFTDNAGDKVALKTRYRLLTERLVKTRPTVLFVQEVQSGDGGKKDGGKKDGGKIAMKKLTDELNKKLKKLRSRDHYKFVPSDRAGGKERYGVLWNTTVLGTDEPEMELWLDCSKQPPFKLCENEHGARALKAARAYATEFGFHSFMRAPLFVRFSKSKIDDLRDVVFCTVHLSAGEKKDNWPDKQYRLESLFLQAVLAAGASSGRQLVLCGDINEDEVKKHMSSLGDAEAWKPQALHAFVKYQEKKKKKWKAYYEDADGEKQSIGYFDSKQAAADAGNKAISDEWHRSAGLDCKAEKAKKCCTLIREPFFALFARVFNDTKDQNVVTNVYPLVKDAAFNDNIFVSKLLSFDDPRVGPLDILAPNLATVMRLEAKKKPTRKTRSDKCLEFAKKIYSDHVDVSVALIMRLMGRRCSIPSFGV